MHQKDFLPIWALLLIAITLTAMGIIVLPRNPKSSPLPANKPTQIPNPSIAESGITACAQDADCTTVLYQGCCFSKKAINKKYVDEYERHPEWQKNEKELAMCPHMRCIPEYRDTAQCIKNICKLVEPNTSPSTSFDSAQDKLLGATGDITDWKTYRNEQYGFEVKYPGEWIVTTTTSDFNTPLFYFQTSQNLADSYVEIAPQGSVGFGLTDEVDSEWIHIGDKRVAAPFISDASKGFYMLVAMQVFDNFPANWTSEHRFYVETHSKDVFSVAKQILSTFRFLE